MTHKWPFYLMMAGGHTGDSPGIPFHKSAQKRSLSHKQFPISEAVNHGANPQATALKLFNGMICVCEDYSW